MCLQQQRYCLLHRVCVFMTITLEIKQITES